MSNEETSGIYPHFLYIDGKLQQFITQQELTITTEIHLDPKKFPSKCPERVS